MFRIFAVETALPALAIVCIDHVGTLAEFLCQPSLFYASFFKHFFHSVHRFIHAFYLGFILQRYKMSCCKKRKAEENSFAFLKLILTLMRGRRILSEKTSPLLVTSESNFLPDSSVERKNIRNFVSDSSYPELTYTITLN